MGKLTKIACYSMQAETVRSNKKNVPYKNRDHNKVPNQQGFPTLQGTLASQVPYDLDSCRAYQLVGFPTRIEIINLTIQMKMDQIHDDRNNQFERIIFDINFISVHLSQILLPYITRNFILHRIYPRYLTYCTLFIQLRNVFIIAGNTLKKIFLNI